MSLSDEVLKGVYGALHGKDSVKSKNVWQVKTISPKLNDSIFYSCRFKNAFGNTFLLSLEICIKDNHPIARCSIHFLCPRRIFSKTLFNQKYTLSPEETISSLMRMPTYINFYNTDRTLPNSILVQYFKKYLHKLTILYITDIEKEKMVW